MNVPGRWNRKPRASQVPKSPASVVRNRFGRQDPPECLHDTTRMDPRPFPRLAVHDRGGLVCSTVGGVGNSASVQAGGLERSVAQHSAGDSQEGGGVRSHHDLGSAFGASGPRLYVHLGPTGVRRRDPVAERCGFAQAGAEHEQSVRLLQPVQHAGRSPGTGHPQVERILVREGVGAAPGRYDRDLELLGKPNERIRASSPKDPRADQDQRPLRVRKKMQNLSDECRVRLAVLVRMAGDDRRHALAGRCDDLVE